MKAQSFKLHVPPLFLYFLFLQYFKMGGFFCTKRVNSIYQGALQEQNTGHIRALSVSEEKYNPNIPPAGWNKQAGERGTRCTLTIPLLKFCILLLPILFMSHQAQVGAYCHR